MVYLYDGFPEKLNGDFDFTQTTGEFPGYWFSENKYVDDFNLILLREPKKNEKDRIVFINFNEAMDFIRSHYIDPILDNRVVRRSDIVNFGSDSFILASPHDTFSDDFFDYYIYDKKLSEQYVEYLFGHDPFIKKFEFMCSKGKIKVRKKWIRHYVHDEEECEFLPTDDDGIHYRDEHLDAYHRSDIYYKEIYAFSLESFLNSGITDYNNFKEKELQTRKKELELFRKIKEENELKEARELEKLREEERIKKAEYEKWRLENGIPEEIYPTVYNSYDAAYRAKHRYDYACELYLKEEKKLKEIYQEIKLHRLRYLSDDKAEIQKFIDKVINDIYESNFENDRIKSGLEYSKSKEKDK